MAPIQRICCWRIRDIILPHSNAKTAVLSPGTADYRGTQALNELEACEYPKKRQYERLDGFDGVETLVVSTHSQQHTILEQIRPPIAPLLSFIGCIHRTTIPQHKHFDKEVFVCVY